MITHCRLSWREVQVGLDRRQRDVHDRDVEHDHELGGDDHREREPAPAILASDCRAVPQFLKSFLVSLQSLSFCHDNRTQRWCATLIPHGNSFHLIIRSAPIHRVAKELVASSGFLLARLGFGFKAQGDQQLEEAGFELYDYSVLAILAEGVARDAGDDRRRAAGSTAAGSSRCSTGSRSAA